VNKTQFIESVWSDWRSACVLDYPGDWK